MAKFSLIRFNGCKEFPEPLQKLGKAPYNNRKWADIPDSFKTQHAPARKKTQNIAELYEALSALCGNGRNCSAATSHEQAYVELDNSDGSTTCVIARKALAGVIFSAKEILRTGVGRTYSVESGSHNPHKGTALLCALIVLGMEEDSELRYYFEEAKKYILREPESLDSNALMEFSDRLLGLSGNLYYRTLMERGLDYSLAYSSFIENLADEQIKEPVMKANIIHGTFKHFGVSEDIGMTPEEVEEGEFPVTEEEYESKVAEFSLLSDGRVLSPEEEKMIPANEPTHKPSKLEDTIVRKMHLSKLRHKKPYKTILLYGGAGGGKSSIARNAARRWGLPFKVHTMHPDSDSISIIGGLYPNTTEDSRTPEEIMKDLGIPSFEDVTDDYEGVYKKLFGKEPEGFDPNVCYTEIFRRMAKEGSNGKDFVFVPSEIVKALANGYCVEIQEPTVVKRPETLVALNALLEDNDSEAVFTLITGETIHRHKDAVVIFTTNRDYEGCQGIQQSVLSRCQIIRSVPNPELEVMVDRCRRETGFPLRKLIFGDSASMEKEDALTKMGKTIEKIEEFCHEENITDGVCGPREFSAWARETMLNAELRDEIHPEKIDTIDVLRAAFPTVIEKATQNEDDKEAIITQCFIPLFGEKAVDDAQDEFENGEW